jgi:hypothetical protein
VRGVSRSTNCLRRTQTQHPPQLCISLFTFFRTSLFVIACVDVQYGADVAIAACVVFHRWTDADAAGEWTERIDATAPYRPGLFYLRELPCILAVLRKARLEPSTLVIDGYVWLGDGMPGLGAHRSKRCIDGRPSSALRRACLPEPRSRDRCSVVEVIARCGSPPPASASMKRSSAFEPWTASIASRHF